jgi:hypothetical protein
VAWAHSVVEFLFQPSQLALIGVASLVLAVVSLIALPWLVARMPPDYFSREPDDSQSSFRNNPVLYVLRNVLAVILLVAGIAMIPLPGQGLLTILAAIICGDFPGKRKLERRIANAAPIQRALNAIRKRAGKPPLEL